MADFHQCSGSCSGCHKKTVRNMKKLRFWAFTLLLVSPLFLPMGVATAQLKDTLEGHTDVVWSVAFSPDGSMLASGSFDQTIRLWNVDTGQILHTLTGHTSDVTSVAFSLNGDTLASASWDSTIRLWDSHTGKHKRTLTDHRGGVASVMFSPDGSTLASGSADQTIRLWDTTTWQSERILTEHTDVVDVVTFSPDEETLASASRDKTVRLWNIHTEQLLHTLTDHTSDITRMAFSPNGDTLASGSTDGTVILWNPQTGKHKSTLTVPVGWHYPVAFSPDGATLLIGGDGISVWDTETKQYKVPLTGTEVVSVVFSPDGQMVASGSADAKVRLWESTRLELPFATIPSDFNNIPEPVPPPAAVREFFELGPFYQQWISVAGYPVIGSAKVNPYALKEVAWVISHMVGHRPDILKTLGEHGERLCVVAVGESFGNLPEYDWYDFPLKFLALHLRDTPCGFCPILFASVEITLDPGAIYSFLIHEFTHVVEGRALSRIDPGFNDRLNATYNAAMEKGLWHGTYSATNKGEYLAEGAGSWFNSAEHKNPIKTRAALKTYDPGLAALLTEIFGNSDWRYTLPATRTHLPHLQGFDPQVPVRAPGLQPWQIWLLEYERQLIDKNSDGGGRWVDLELYDPSQLPVLLESVTPGGGSYFIFVNLTGQEISFYTVAADGAENFRWRSSGHRSSIGETSFNSMDLGTYVGAIWLIKDHNGEALAVFRAEEKVGRVLISATPILITSGLSKISDDNQADVSGTILANPFIIEVRDENLSVLEGIPVTFTVTAGDGTLSVMHTMTDENGRAESTLTLGPNLGTNTVSVSAAGIEGVVTFNAVGETPVDITDPNLRAIEQALGKAPGAGITVQEMATLIHLEARNANISDLTGLEAATNLTGLYLGAEWVEAERRYINSNSVSNLSPLAGLTKLTELLLHYNAITDISPLVGLTNLTFLWLEGNNITNIASVAGLTNLTRLDFGRNSISDISAVAKLTHLTSLWFWGNSISDITPVTGLTNLTQLGLWNNNISDLSPLVANMGLGSGDTVYVQSNPLSYQSIHTYIPTLQSRGVTVEFDNRPHPALLKIAGDNQKGASFAPLSQPFVIEAQDANGSALVDFSVRFAVTEGGGTLSTTIIRTDENGRAQSTLILGPNLGTNTVEVSAAGIESTDTFYAIADTELPPMTADVNSDGNVNVLDLILIASKFGNVGPNLVEDINRDGVISILDLVLAAGMFDSAAAAPSAHPQDPETFTAVEVQGWLTGARSLEVRDPIMKRGIMMLEQLLVSLTPRETELLANYPNPFNPETWIPYRLAEDANVTLTIYESSGQVVRTLDVGHRIASAYESRSKAVYWDGRNEFGEPVASGIYFYTLTTGDYSATRRMVILK